MAVHGATEPDPVSRVVPITRRDVVPVVGLYIVATLIYVLLGRRQVLPLVTPDEFTYGHLARSLADGDGFTWRGADVPLRAALYVYVITPAWLISNTLTAYAVAKVIGAALLCTVVVPAWLLARQYLSPGLALLLAALTLAGTWMTTASALVTENLAFPLASCCLAATVMALRRPGSRWAWVALGFCVFAAWARFQLLLLLPVIAAAAMLDIARAGDREARLVRWHGHRPLLLTIGAVLAIGLVVSLADFNLVAGSYSGARDFSPSFKRIISAIGESWLALYAMAGFVPLVIIVSLAGTRRAWRDDATGPLLAVLVPAILLFVVVSGWATAGFKAPWHIQRYVEYVLPLAFLLVTVVAGRRTLLPRATWIVALVLGAAALLGPTANPGEGRGYYAAAAGARDLLGVSDPSGVAIVGLAAGLLATALLLGVRSRGGSPRAAWIIVALLILGVGLQAQQSWRWQIDKAREWRAGFPRDLRAVDHAARGPVARIFITTSHPRFETVDFFNRDVTQTFVPNDNAGNGRVIHGRTCRWSIDRAGTAHFAKGCGADPTRFYIDDPSAVLTFQGQRIIRRIHGLGRIVAVPGPPAKPRLRSIAVLPCDDRTLVLKTGRVLGFAPRTCRSAFSVLLWLDAPGTLTIGIRGGRAEHVGQIGKQVFRIPPVKVSTIHVQVPKGSSRLDLRFDTQELPRGLPDVTSAVLTGGGHRQSLL